MRFSPENSRLALLIIWYWIVSFLRVTFSNAARFISQVSNENKDQQSLLPEDLSKVIKVVKGVRWLSPLFLNKRKCLMEALIVFCALRKIGIYSQIRLGAKTKKNSLKTHAWVSIGNTTIIGGPISDYEELIRTR